MNSEMRKIHRERARRFEKEDRELMRRVVEELCVCGLPGDRVLAVDLREAAIGAGLLSGMVSKTMWGRRASRYADVLPFLEGA